MKRLNKTVEEQAEYKSITAKEMIETACSYGHQKIMINSHKDNLLGRDFENLKKRLDEEYAEYKKALIIYLSNRTEKNAEEFRKEGGDCINFISAMMVKTGGYNNLIRE